MRFKMVDRSDTDFLFYCLGHKRFIDFLAHEGMTGSDLPHITGTGVAEFSIALPPQAEQGEVVRRIESLLALAETIERRVEGAMSRAERLPQAILSKAFSGELVPTEAELTRTMGRANESAEAPLARHRNSPETSSSSEPAKPKKTRRREEGTRPSMGRR